MHDNYHRSIAYFQQTRGGREGRGGFNRANNERLRPNPHPETRRAGGLRVKKLDYSSPSDHITHKPSSRTSGHLEDITGNAKPMGRGRQGVGGFGEVANF